MIFSTGSCYKNVNEPPPPNHYWFLLSDPTLDSNRIMVANVTEWDDWDGDGACRLDDGDHPDFYKPSYVNYDDAKMVTLATLEGIHKSGHIDPRESASKELLVRMQRGVLDSEFCSNDFKALLTEQGLPEV